MAEITDTPEQITKETGTGNIEPRKFDVGSQERPEVEIYQTGVTPSPDVEIKTYSERGVPAGTEQRVADIAPPPMREIPIDSITKEQWKYEKDFQGNDVIKIEAQRRGEEIVDLEFNRNEVESYPNPARYINQRLNM